MGKHVGKRILVFVLTIALVIGMIPVFPMEKVEASTVITEAEMTARVKDLAVKLGLDGDLKESTGANFTADGTACAADHIKCEKCYVKNIITCTGGTWFQDTFGFRLSGESQLPTYYGGTSDTMGTNCASCAGFAKFALWYVGRTNNTDSFTSSDIVMLSQGEPYNEQNLRACNLRIGDVLRLLNSNSGSAGHSVMFLRYASNGIVVMDSNWNTKCGIQIHTIPYTSSAYAGHNFGATRLANYDPYADRPDVPSSFPLIDGAYYTIWNHAAGKNLDMAGCTDASNAIINDITPGKASQIFKAVQHADGYSFVSVTTGYALDMYGNAMGIGGEVKLCSYHGAPNQRFKLVDEGDGFYSMRPVSSRLALTYNGAADAGTNIIQGSCDSSNATKWGFAQCAIPTEFPLVDGGLYYIWNHEAGKFMDYDGTTAGSAIVLKDKVENKPSQLWKAVKCDDGYTFISSETGLALDVMAGSADAGAMICQSTYHGGANQRFKILTRGDGYYTIRSVGSDLPFSVADDAVSVIQTNHDGTNGMVWGFAQYVETTPPVITDAKVTNVTSSGYTVEATVTDNVGLARVQFPTWTESNGQDDLIANWETNSAITGTANGNTYTFRVKDSDHNFERGKYITLVYAFDSSGNASYAEVNCDLQNDGTVVSENTYDGHTYKLIDDKMTWHEAKAACEAMGGHLVTINSAEEQQVIESMLPADATCSGYHIGGYTENEQSKWVTGESFDYSNWYEGQPDGTNGTVTEDVYAICTSLYPEGWAGKWNDIASDTPGYGYICEFEPVTVEITDITLSESEVEVGFGQTKEIEATVSPAEGYHPPIVWTSENESIATVSNGTITGVGPGTTKIWAECGGKKASCTVTVVKPFESITLNLADKTLFKNETCKLEATLAPADANASKELVWTSANPAVATVNSNGVVTARGVGSTQITVALKNNEAVSATCTITVESYVVTFDTKGGSSIAPIECGKNETLALTQEPTKDGYAFTGWFKDAECTIPWDMENDVVNSNITLYAGWMEYHEGLWIVDIPAQQYTGKAIKPEITVYHYAQKLESGKDYTVSYKNNTNAGDVTAAKAPTVTVKGKGNYTGKETANFTILAKNLTDIDITADNIYLAANGKVLKPVPVVTWNNKKLKNNKDFTVAYPDTTPGAYQNNGTYTVHIVGKGNFTGERTVQLQITGSNLMSKAKVSKIASQAYTGNAIEPEFTVKFGSTMLTKGVDYSVSYHNNVSTGTATAVLTGMGSYVGEKKVTFKIVGAAISKAKVLNLPQSVPYTGKAIKDVNYQLQLENNGSTMTLVENQDYTVSYKNNTNAGTATITFKGINGYSGTLKKTFKITPYNLGENASNVSATLASSVAYMKGATAPEPKVTCFGKTLKKDKDYKLTYKNNKGVYTGNDSGKMPTVTITGKGNYTGTITLSFNIETQDIGQLTMTAPDKVYQTKAGKHVSAPVIKDVNGKKLAAGKDYEKALVYTYTNSTTLGDGTVRSAGAKIEASDILPAGTSVTVTAKGMNNYTGEISCTYRITQASISKAKGKIDAQIYTGKAIEPGKSDITLKVGKTTLAPTDYEIVSYSNNVRKGTATVVVKGVGNYGGTKTIKFKIKSKLFSWWWR